MDDMRLDYEREHHQSIIFEDNERGVDDEKAILHAKKWYFYMDEKQ